MEVKQNITISVRKNDQEFLFIMPSGSTWGNAIDSSFEILQEVSKLYNNAVSQAQPKEIKE